MKAETAYNVIEALPQQELQRLLLMIDKKMQPQPSPKPIKISKVWSKAECTEIVIKILNDRKRNRTTSKC